MDSTQQPVTPVAAAPPGIFGTRIPSAVAFTVGILLFLLPFAEIKCSNTTLANISGLNIALRKDWKPLSNGLPGKKGVEDKTSSKTNSGEKGNSWMYAIAALGLGGLGLLLSLANARSAASGALITGILSAGALIGMMLDLKKWFNDSLAKDAMNKAQEGTNDLGLNKIGDSFNNIKPTLDFTPWFYVAAVAFLAAAFFSYRRMAAAGKINQ